MVHKYASTLLQNANTRSVELLEGSVYTGSFHKILCLSRCYVGRLKRCNYALGVIMLSIVCAETTCPVLTALNHNVIYLAYTKVHLTVKN